MKKNCIMLLAVFLSVLLTGCASNQISNNATTNQTPANQKTTITSRDGNFEYVLLENGTAKLYYYLGNEERHTVPAKIDGIPVSTLGQGCYSSSLKSVTIPNNIQLFVEG